MTRHLELAKSGDYVRTSHDNIFVMFETKNTHELDAPAINQTATYLGDRVGRLGVFRRILMPHTPEQNKAIVREFYDLAFNQRQPETAVAKHVGGMYRQHNPMAGDGPGPFISFVKWFTGENPQMRFDFKRFIADGDLVAVHSHLRLSPEARGTAVMDIFRLENGKIVEHWDVLQEVPETAENQNTMF